MFLKFEQNNSGKDYCVGDCHGEFLRLSAMLKAISFDESKDRLFSVGDLCDRGPNSDQVLNWLEQPWFHPVAGNHEQLLIDASDPLNSNAEATLFINGGQWFFGLPFDKQKEISFAFSSLPVMIEVQVGNKVFGIVHSDVLANDWNKTREELVYNEFHTKSHVQWDRNRQNFEDEHPVSGLDFLLVGHTPIEHAKILGNVINLDSGAVFRGKYVEHSDGLTILNMTDFEFYKESDYD